MGAARRTPAAQPVEVAARITACIQSCVPISALSPEFSHVVFFIVSLAVILGACSSLRTSLPLKFHIIGYNRI